MGKTTGQRFPRTLRNRRFVLKMYILERMHRTIRNAAEWYARQAVYVVGTSWWTKESQATLRCLDSYESDTAPPPQNVSATPNVSPNLTTPLDANTAACFHSWFLAPLY